MSILRALLITDPLIILATFFYGSVSLMVSVFERDGRRQMAIARAWSRALLWVSGVKVKVEGLEKVSKDASYILVSNHASYMDTPVVLANIPVQFRFLAKQGLFQIPLLGGHLTRSGHIPVPRENARAALKTMNLAARIVRERGISLLVFPEGGRSRTGELGPFKEGAAYIAIRAGVPLLPVSLKGTRAILPFGSGHIRTGQVTIRIGDPILTDQASLHDRERLTEELRHQIVALLEEQPIHA